MNRHAFGLMMWLGGFCLQIHAQQVLSPNHLDPLIQQMMTQAKVPGLSLALLRPNEPISLKMYGLTKADSSQKVDVNTVFEAASLTKPIFAYAILQLVEAGKIDLDKPLYQYLPYPDAAFDGRYKQITARLVLSHRSGFPNWRRNRQKPRVDMSFTPGERFGYSGEGFVYLQKVVEKITGMPINDWMEQQVLKPLEMNHSGFVWKADFESDFAFPHDDKKAIGQKYKPTQANIAYSLHTTAADYALFLQALLDSKGLNQALLAEMLSSQTPLPKRFSGGEIVPQSFWGLGMGVEKLPEGTYLWHWGDNGDFKAFYMVNLTKKEGMVYLANGEKGLDFADEITHHTVGGTHHAFSFLGINWQEELKRQK